MWSGSAASWVDLHPAGALESVAIATSGSQQVGYAWFGAWDRASLWSGSAASWVDLTSFLTGQWLDTRAYDIWSDGTTTHISGVGFNLATGRYEALLWTHVVPEPGTGLLLGLGGLLAARRRR
jgi:hypothetical protein